ncbi:tRNA (guanine(37)-N(1))-methyltransferase [Candidatus Roizmanbacteria bacterium]|jgi:tRNA (guanine37-N1)-methyltransferase|nr:tRNA (guanine(37)-N(1))-methyltransferase [Candidatus Roizmanbacteria bacterium]
MKITVITLFPKMISGFFDESIVKKAGEKGLVELSLVNLRDFAIDDYGTVDDRPYGGGAGMVLRVDVIDKAIKKITNHKSPFDFTQGKQTTRKIQNSKSKIVLTSARGKVFNQKKAIEYSKLDDLIIIAGHYEGVDERVVELVDEEVSMGDFIMTGGEILASSICDSVVRLLPGVLKKTAATEKESFSEVDIDLVANAIGNNDILTSLKEKGCQKIRLLEYPQYTRPEKYLDRSVPKVLLSGNPKEIEKWQIKKSWEETLKRRPDLIG